MPTKLKGVGGWLAFLIVVMTILGPLLSFGTIFGNLGHLDDEFGGSPPPEWSAYKTITWSFFWAGVVPSVVAGLRLDRDLRPISVKLAIAALWIAGPILYSANIIVLSAVVGPEWRPDEFVGPILVSAFGPLVWTLYLIFSRRVRNTYYASGQDGDDTAEEGGNAVKPGRDERTP